MPKNGGWVGAYKPFPVLEGKMLLEWLGTQYAAHKCSLPLSRSVVGSQNTRNSRGVSAAAWSPSLFSWNKRKSSFVVNCTCSNCYWHWNRNAHKNVDPDWLFLLFIGCRGEAYHWELSQLLRQLSLTLTHSVRVKAGTLALLSLFSERLPITRLNAERKPEMHM